MSQVKSLKTGIKFKETPIGKIPVDWDLKPFVDVMVLQRGFDLPVQNRKKGQYPILASNGIIDCHNEFKVKGPGVITGRSGSLGKVHYIEGDYWPLNTTLYVKNYFHNYPKFLYYFLQSFKIEKFGTGTSVPTLNRNIVHEIKVAIPPLSEQKRIAEILSNVDDAIEGTDKIIEKTKELKKGLMQKLLTKGIGHRKFKKTEIGRIPVEWKVGQVSDYGEIVTGNTPKTSVQEFYGNDYPFVSPFNLGTSKIIMSSEKNLSEKGSVVARLLPMNAVLFVCIGSTIGKTGVVGKQLAINQQINSIICNKNDYNFVYYYLTFISSNIKKLAGIQAIPIVNKSLFSSIAIAIPSNNEQRKIGNILSSIDLEIENEENKKQELVTLKKSLMQILLTGKIRVEIP